jgi:hypothetical protein
MKEAWQWVGAWRQCPKPNFNPIMPSINLTISFFCQKKKKEATSIQGIPRGLINYFSLYNQKFFEPSLCVHSYARKPRNYNFYFIFYFMMETLLS